MHARFVTLPIIARRFQRLVTTMDQAQVALKIGTHSGTFHCDEVLGCWMLKKTERYKGADIVRTRDQEILKTMDAVLDVGGIYNPEEQRFDHHQKGFVEVFGHGHAIKLSTAGLVYRHFGKHVLASILHPMKLTEADMESVYLKVYEGFMKAVDAIDNGINPWEDDQEPKYFDSTNLGSRVSRLNTSWNEESTESSQDIRFIKAMELCGTEFSDYVQEIAKRWLPARSIVMDALKERFTIHKSGELLSLNQYCPWKSHLIQLEKELNISGTIKFVLLFDGKEYRIQTVPVSLGSFTSRLLLPNKWRGLRGPDLDSLIGIEGSVFVHMGGFIGGHKTKEGIFKMAHEAVSLASSDPPPKP